MKLSFATLGCPAWSMAQIVDNARAMGFDGVELRGIAGEHIGPDESPESRAAIRQAFEQAGLRVACIMGYSRFTAGDPARRQADIDVIIKLLQVAHDIGCPTLRVFGGTWDTGDRQENIGRAVEALRTVTAAAAKLKVRVALETHDDWCKGANVRALLDGVASPALGVCWDIANASFVEPLEETFPFIKDNIIHVHFKDAARDADGKIHSKLPGQGQVDMAHGLSLLQRARYDGWLSFEWEKKWEPQLADPEIAFPHYLQHATKLMTQAGVKRG
jgi:sugar phosphate isomerase/epimerase